jgi:surfeit locus 1 family protein
MRVTQEPGATPYRSRGIRLIFVSAMLVLTAVFTGLGLWQIQRLSWKLDLIARVEARIHADPAPVPRRAQWDTISAQTDEYRRITATGLFEHGKSVLVQAVTERGAGFWLMTPLRLPDSSIVLVNRGFLPDRAPATRLASEIAAGPVTVTGLLRISEPGGAFLRSNDPVNDRWYSRDVAAIALAKDLASVAPYFIDADATPNPGGFPVGGLTAISFRNSHLVYAFTWFSLAFMALGVTIVLYRRKQI